MGKCFCHLRLALVIGHCTHVTPLNSQSVNMCWSEQSWLLRETLVCLVAQGHPPTASRAANAT